MATYRPYIYNKVHIKMMPDSLFPGFQKVTRGTGQAYAKGAVVTCPAMDDYEGKIVRLPVVQRVEEQREPEGAEKLAG